MITYKLHLICHGLTEANLQGKYIGKLDEPLCDRGVEDLLTLQGTYRYPTAEAVYSSPLARCVQTAELLYPDVYLQIVDDLRELDFGTFDGCTAEELQNNPAFLAWLEDSATSAPPGGESGAQLFARIHNALDQILRNMMEEEISSAAVITHGGIIAMLLSACGLPKGSIEEWRAPHGEGFTISLSAQMWLRDGVFEVITMLPLEKGDDYQGWESDFDDPLIDDDWEETP